LLFLILEFNLVNQLIDLSKIRFSDQKLLLSTFFFYVVYFFFFDE
jgi:hypothetical protein